MLTIETKPIETKSVETKSTKLTPEFHSSILGNNAFKLNITAFRPISNNQFFDFCQQNRDLRIELTQEGDLIIMAPAGSGSSHKNALITYQLVGWSNQDGKGRSFDSSGGFILPSGAMRSPDACWISNNQLKNLSKTDWEKFLPLCPEFVIELRSASDSLRELQKKMLEYIENGAQLGWLIDPKEKRVYVYTPDNLKVLENPKSVSAAPLLQDFNLDLEDIFKSIF